MREIVIVIADLYLTEAPNAAQPQGPAMPGLAQVARYGESSRLEAGWRPWLATWLGRPDLGLAPAIVVAAATTLADPASRPAMPPRVGGSEHRTSDTTLDADRTLETVWLATPLHLMAGLTTLHADFRSGVHLTHPELELLARDFRLLFGASGFRITPLETGEFLLRLRSVPPVQTCEPARLYATDISAALPTGNGALFLRRLGAEIEIWLHTHPLNETRGHRGNLTVSTLWIWGGGPAASNLKPTPEIELATTNRGASDADRTASRFALFARDAFVSAVGKLAGSSCHNVPEQLDAVFGYPGVEQATVVVEVGHALRKLASRSVQEALGELDRRFIAPAVAALRRGDVGQVSILANDRRLTLRKRDHLKFWRRPREGLMGLQ